jgi:hypothetical protein
MCWHHERAKWRRLGVSTRRRWHNHRPQFGQPSLTVLLSPPSRRSLACRNSSDLVGRTRDADALGRRSSCSSQSSETDLALTRAAVVSLQVGCAGKSPTLKKMSLVSRCPEAADSAEVSFVEL